MRKTEVLKDGSKIVIRNLARTDLDKLMDFYRSLPEGDRKYLRVDVTDRSVIEQRIKKTRSGDLIRIIALHEEEIIADGALHLSTEDWRKHQGELRVIVSRPYRRKGVGMILMRELYFLAAEKKVKQVVARIMRPQAAAKKICRKLGFKEELIIPDYVRDRAGRAQDLVIMICNMKDLWKELDHFYSDSDWQRCR
ncbi:MAG: GNAT family N-acetyltransferase [Candidatus Aminicenantes bacterium]|jgi:L-amino acid N-acyltransferase YncA